MPHAARCQVTGTEYRAYPARTEVDEMLRSTLKLISAVSVNLQHVNHL